MNKSKTITGEDFNQNRTIAIFSNSFWNLKNFRREIIERLYELNYNLILIYPYDDDVHKIDFSYCKHVVLHELKVLSKSIWNDYKFYKEISRVFQKNHIDLVLSFTIKPNIYGSMVAKAYGIPCIATVTGLGKEIIKGNLFSKLLNTIYKNSVRSDQFVVFHNEEDLITFDPQRLHSNYIVINGSGVNTKVFSKSENVENKSLHKFIFLFSGRLIKSKGIMEFLEAAAKVKSENSELQFWIIGKHSEEELDVYNLLMDHQERGIIIYCGFIDQPKEILSQVQVLVLPSYREGKSKSILEAMSMQIPVICSDVAGCHDLIKNNWNGILINAKDSSALANAMRSMALLNESERLQMGLRSREEVVKNYDVNIISNKYLELIDSIFYNIKSKNFKN